MEQSKDNSGKIDHNYIEENTDTSSSSSNHMDEWFKTLEEFDMGSGSEMLRQIGLSLRERSSTSQDQPEVRSSRLDASDNKSLGLKQRSKSASRFNQPPSASASVDLANPKGKPPISKKPDLKSLRAKKPDFGNSTTEAALSNSYSVNIELSTFKSSDSDTDNSSKSQRPALPPRSAKTLPTAKRQSISNGNSGAPPPLPVKPKFSTSSSSDADQQASNGAKKTKDQIQTIFTPSPLQLQRVVLEKKSPLDDFGFSLSDALDGCGVFVSSVRGGSLAEEAGLKAYDRVLQVYLPFADVNN